MSDRASELRVAFDAAFAERPALPTAASDDLLSIRVAGRARLLRLADISGLFVGKKVTPLPARRPELLGVAGFRGVVLPVYDLGLLTGVSGSIAPTAMAIIATAPVAIAFEAFEGSVKEASAIDTGDRAVIDMAAVLAAITGLNAPASSTRSTSREDQT